MIFDGVEFDDYTVDEDNIWSQVCQEHSEKWGGAESNNGILHECAGEPICGVKGCDKTAEYYIDFPAGEYLKKAGMSDPCDSCKRGVQECWNVKHRLKCVRYITHDNYRIRKALKEKIETVNALEKQITDYLAERAKLEAEARGYRHQFQGLLDEIAMLLDRIMMKIDTNNKEAVGFMDELAILLDKRRMQIDSDYERMKRNEKNE